MSVKVTYIDGTIDEISGASDWEFETETENGNEKLQILDRKFDKDRQYDEDEDVILAEINFDQVRKVEK